MLVPLYQFPQPQVVRHPVTDSPLRTSSLRSLGAHMNVFAIESFMDELAFAAGVDPVEFRRRHLAHDKHAMQVLDAVLDLSGGVQGPRGMAIARYKNIQCCVAIIIEVIVSDDASVTVQRVWIAADAGRAVDPDGLVNQLEGGTVQALSWCLKEAVTFDAEGVTSVDWNSYPILRFSEVPRMETVILDYPGLDPLGAGEATVGPASAALANAVFAAAGVRVRDLPMTPERLREAAAMRVIVRRRDPARRRCFRRCRIDPTSAKSRCRGSSRPYRHALQTALRRSAISIHDRSTRYWLPIRLRVGRKPIPRIRAPL